MFSKFFTRRSVKASSSSSVLLVPEEGGGAGGGLMSDLVSLVAVILTGFGETGGGIFLPVTGSKRTAVRAAIVYNQQRINEALNSVLCFDCAVMQSGQWIVLLPCLVCRRQMT